MITLANPVGLYIDHLDDAGFRLPGDLPVTGDFDKVRLTAQEECGYSVR